MKKVILVTSVILISAITSRAQNFDWAQRIGGTGYTRVADIKTDASGNIFLAGFFQDTIDFDPGPGSYTLTAAGGKDAFLCKLNPAGNLLWVIQTGSPSTEIYYSNILFDNSGHVFVTGIMFGQFAVDLDPGPGLFNITSAGGFDIFVCKFDTAFNFIWARQFGNSASDDLSGADLDANSNIILTGRFQWTVDFDPGPSTYNLTSLGNRDNFLLKLDSAGNFIWAKSWGSVIYDETNDVQTDSLTIYVTGRVNNSAFLSQFDQAGNVAWTNNWGYNLGTRGIRILIDKMHDVYVAGALEDSADFNTGTGVLNLFSNGMDDISLSKFSPSGIFNWAKSWGGKSIDGAADMAMDTTGNIYVCGSFVDSVDFDPGSGASILYAPLGFWDPFICKLDTAGNLFWANSFTGNGNANPFKILINADQHIISTGSFADTTDFDPGSSTYFMAATGEYDIYITKLMQPIVGVDEKPIADLLSVYPNPSQGIFNLKLKYKSNILIIDLTGRKVLSLHLNAGLHTLDLSHQSPGMYFVLLNGNFATPAKKMIID